MTQSTSPKRRLQRRFWLLAGLVFSAILMGLISIVYFGYRQQQIVNEVREFAMIKSVPVFGNRWKEFAGEKWEHAFSHKISIELSGYRTNEQIALVAKLMRLSFNGFIGPAECELHANFIDDEQMKILDGSTNLRVLTIWRANVSDIGMQHVKGLRNLERFWMNQSQITDSGLVHLKSLARLKSLTLEFEHSITDAGLMQLAELTTLQSLVLNHTSITDAGLKQLSKLSNLESLDIGGTQITDAGMVHLAGLTSLRSLDLSNTQITDAGLLKLTTLSNLTNLNIYETQITDDGITHLAKFHKLAQVTLPAKISSARIAKLKLTFPTATISLEPDFKLDSGWY